MESRTNQIQKWVSIAVALMSILVMPFAIWSSLNKKSVSEIRTTVIESEFRELENQVKELDKQNKMYISRLESLSTAIDETIKNDPKSLDNAKVSAELNKIKKDIVAIQTALGSDLERSLSVPLLRKDLAQLKSQITERATASSKEIDRIYDQNKWFLGLMGTMAVGLLGLAISNFLQSKRDEG